MLYTVGREILGVENTRKCTIAVYYEVIRGLNFADTGHVACKCTRAQCSNIYFVNNLFAVWDIMPTKIFRPTMSRWWLKISIQRLHDENTVIHNFTHWQELMSYHNIPVDWRTRLGNPLPQVSHPAVISHNILSHTISGLLLSHTISGLLLSHTISGLLFSFYPLQY